MPFLFKFFTYAGIALFALSCTQKDSSEASTTPVGLPEGFNEFYVRFHRDTAFQMAHISWPLQGIKAGFEPDTTGYWTRGEWQPHTIIPSSMEYDQQFNVLTEDLVVETIRDRESQYAMQRRFARMSGGWSLIYYVEMQPTRPNNTSN